MKIEIDENGFRFPEVLLPQVWTGEQLFDTPALSTAEAESETRASMQALLKITNSALARQSQLGWATGAKIILF